MRVLRLRECVAPERPCDCAERCAAYWRENVATAAAFDPDKEHFVVLLLNTRRRLLAHNLVAMGGLDAVAVVPREVFRPAIALAAAALVLMHQHPSGDPTPSDSDIRVTRTLMQAGVLLALPVIDHVIMGASTPEHPKDYLSLKELGYFQ